VELNHYWSGEFEPGLSTRAQNIAGVQLAAGEDLMLSLEAALFGGHAVGPYVIARAALEALGRAHELLDPGLTPRSRAIAGLNYDLTSYYAALHLERRHPSDPSSERGQTAKAIRSRISELERKARQFGFAVQPSKGNRPPVVEIPVSSYSEVITKLLPEGHEPHGWGRVLAAAYASFAHADPLAILSIGDARGEEVMDLNQLDGLTLDEEAIVTVVSPVVFGHLAAYQRQVDAYGWGQSKWRDWSRHARFIIRRHVARLEREADS
jgi:hypothetical protein